MQNDDLIPGHRYSFIRLDVRWEPTVAFNGTPAQATNADSAVVRFITAHAAQAGGQLHGSGPQGRRFLFVAREAHAFDDSALAAMNIIDSWRIAMREAQRQAPIEAPYVVQMALDVAPAYYCESIDQISGNFISGAVLEIAPKGEPFLALSQEIYENLTAQLKAEFRGFSVANFSKELYQYASVSFTVSNCPADLNSVQEDPTPPSPTLSNSQIDKAVAVEDPGLSIPSGPRAADQPEKGVADSKALSVVFGGGRRPISCALQFILCMLGLAAVMPLIRGVTSGGRIPSHYSSELHQVTKPLAFCSESTLEWIGKAQQSSPKSPGELLPYGARDAKQVILHGQSILSLGRMGQSLRPQNPPVLYIPADDYWLAKLERDYPRFHPQSRGRALYSRREELCSSRLVLAMTSEHAVWFQRERQKAEYQGKTWRLVAQVCRNGWPSGNSASRSAPRLLLPDPRSAHAGLAALYLMYREFCGEENVPPSHPAFGKFLRGLPAATDRREKTANAMLQAFVSTPALRDHLVVCYEADVRQRLQAYPSTDLAVVYPDPTATVRFAAGVFSTDWVSEEQARTAGQLLDKLISSEFQNEAAELGFRTRELSVNDVRDRFLAQRLDVRGFVADPESIDVDPSPSILEDLPYQWLLAKDPEGVAVGRPGAK